MTTQTGPFAEPWPPGVIARCLNQVDAPIDLTHLDKATRAKCNGCGQHADHKTQDYYIGSGREPVYFQNRDKADRDARKWAQDHADKCRFQARPAVTS